MGLLITDQGPLPLRKEKTREKIKERCGRGLWMKAATSLPAFDGARETKGRATSRLN